MQDNAERAYLSPDKDFTMVILCQLGALENHCSLIQSHDLVDALLLAYNSACFEMADREPSGNSRAIP